MLTEKRANLNLKPNTPGPKERWEKFVYRERLHEHVTHPWGEWKWKGNTQHIIVNMTAQCRHYRQWLNACVSGTGLTHSITEKS